MSTLIINNDLLYVEYKENVDLAISRFKNFDTAEEYIRGIKMYKNEFDKILPSKIIWDLTQFDFIIEPELQKWVYDFLEKPANEIGINFEVGHVVPSNILAQVSIMEIYAKNDPLNYYPKYFSNLNQATQWMAKQDAKSEDLRISVDRNYEENRANIKVDIPLDLLQDYLSEFRKIINNRAFLREKFHKYQMLTIREKQILSLVTRHFSNYEISERLTITIDTTKSHRKNIIKKLDCKSTAELMMYSVFG